jgi:LPS sulfotransferase NodH
MSPPRGEPGAGNFVILCLGRTGSEHLVSLLNSHPQVRCFGELFGPGPVPWRRYFVNSATDDPVRYLAGLFDGSGDRAVGFKLTHDCMLAHPRAREVLDAFDLAVIRLRRRNHLAQYVSAQLASATGVWHSRREPVQAARIRLDPQACIRTLAALERQDAGLDALADGHRRLDLDYEELADGEGVEETLERFLGVAPHPLTSRHRRLRSGQLEDVVENWPEIERALRPTRFAPTLHERGNDPSPTLDEEPRSEIADG